ncbi:hypothetical protein chiPu_0023617, partial [Chiloscyllium punctatum]|nr:hypothetical protein [Chiloscyllium punctatum]
MVIVAVHHAQTPPPFPRRLVDATIHHSQAPIECSPLSVIVVVDHGSHNPTLPSRIGRHRCRSYPRPTPFSPLRFGVTAVIHP